MDLVESIPLAGDRSKLRNTSLVALKNNQGVHATGRSVATHESRERLDLSIGHYPPLGKAVHKLRNKKNKNKE